MTCFFWVASCWKKALAADHLVNCILKHGFAIVINPTVWWSFHDNSCNPLTNLAAIHRQVLVIDPSSNSLMPRSNFTVQVWGMDEDIRWLNFECSGLWQWTPTPQTWTLLAAVPLKNRQLLKSRLFLDSQDLFHNDTIQPLGFCLQISEILWYDTTPFTLHL